MPVKDSRRQQLHIQKLLFNVATEDIQSPAGVEFAHLYRSRNGKTHLCNKEDTIISSCNLTKKKVQRTRPTQLVTKWGFFGSDFLHVSLSVKSMFCARMEERS